MKMMILERPITTTANACQLQIKVANSFVSRFRGLMFSPPLPPATGLLLAPCNSIHMLFMRFPLDVIYIDQDYRILKTVEKLSPWIGLSACIQSQVWGVLELPVGTIQEFQLQVGQQFFIHKEE